MFKIVSVKKYNEMKLKIEAQIALLHGISNTVEELRAKLNESEKEKHNLVEQVRYTLQTAVREIDKAEVDTGKLEYVSESLPYLLSGFRHWDEQEIIINHNSIREDMSEVARKYNFELPLDGYQAVMAMLNLSMTLMNPLQSAPLESLQQQYPVKKEGNSNE